MSQWTHKMDSLANVIEEKYHLPKNICYAFSAKESAHNPFAFRVEKKKITDPILISKAKLFSVKHHGIPSELTENVQLGSSFTQFQIMFNNLRAMNCDSLFATQISIEDAFNYFGMFVSNLWNYYHNIECVASAYNGGEEIVRDKNNKIILKRPHKLLNGQFKNQVYVNELVYFFTHKK